MPKASKNKTAKSASMNKGVRKIIADIKSERKKISDSITNAQSLFEKNRNKASKIKDESKKLLKSVKKQQ